MKNAHGVELRQWAVVKVRFRPTDRDNIQLLSFPTMGTAPMAASTGSTSSTERKRRRGALQGSINPFLTLRTVWSF